MLADGVGSGLVLADGVGTGLVLACCVGSGLVLAGCVGSGWLLVDGVAIGWVVHAAGFLPSIVMCANTLNSKPRSCGLPLSETHRLSASGASIISCVLVNFLALTW